MAYKEYDKINIVTRYDEQDLKIIVQSNTEFKHSYITTINDIHNTNIQLYHNN